MHQFFRQHFRAFLHYLEDTEPVLSVHTEYMQKMHKHILRVMKVLLECGYERLISICHGDAKPNNFLFRNISIELDDCEELNCEGLQSILIDWQGGFVGSVANDLMWAIYPFLEANKEIKVTLHFSVNSTIFCKSNLTKFSFIVKGKQLKLWNKGKLCR